MEEIVNQFVDLDVQESRQYSLEAMLVRPPVLLISCNPCLRRDIVNRFGDGAVQMKKNTHQISGALDLWCPLLVFQHRQ